MCIASSKAAKQQKHAVFDGRVAHRAQLGVRVRVRSVRVRVRSVRVRVRSGSPSPARARSRPRDSGRVKGRVLDMKVHREEREKVLGRKDGMETSWERVLAKERAQVKEQGR